MKTTLDLPILSVAIPAEHLTAQAAKQSEAASQAQALLPKRPARVSKRAGRMLAQAAKKAQPQ